MKPYLLIALSIAFLSCKKEVLPVPALVFGNETGMEISYSGKLVKATLQSPDRNYQIDIDEDGIMDVRFHSSVRFQELLGVSSETWIEPLHSGFKLLATSTEDTLFVRYGFQLTTDPVGDTIGIQSTVYSCERESPFSMVDDIVTTHRLDHKSKGEVITTLDNFVFNSLHFRQANTSSFEPSGLVVNGMVYHDLISHHYNCSAFPNDVLRYVGFRFEYPDGTRRLGWIRMELDDESILLNSWAIHKVED